MNFAQNQRECQDKSPMYMTEEKQIYLIKKKKTVGLRTLIIYNATLLG